MIAGKFGVLQVVVVVRRDRTQQNSKNQTYQDGANLNRCRAVIRWSVQVEFMLLTDELTC